MTPGESPTERYGAEDWLLFWYLNRERIDSLFSQLNGRLETERKETVSKGVGGTGKLGFEIGNILALVGLAKGSAEAEVRSDYESIREVTSSLSMENKVIVLLNYFRRADMLVKVHLAAGDPNQTVRQIASRRFQLLAGWLNWQDTGDGRSELLSHALTADGSPLVRIPLLETNILQQQGPFYDEPGGMPHLTFCACLVRGSRVLVRPIAIWFPDVDQDSEEIQW
jgi:hypothetical protein